MPKIGIYTKKVIKHFENPHNYGKMKNPDGVGKVGNPVCGDVMWLYIRIGKNKNLASGKNLVSSRSLGNKKGEEIIRDIKFETFGCVAAIATSSVITDLAKGKTLEEALKIEKNKIVRSLGGLPPIKLHCSVLAADALVEAIYDYLLKQKRKIPKELEEKHKGIGKEKDFINKRYKKWTGIEEKMHGNK